jgi:ATP/maltotriose-dependent transcriptional regulator MalT
LQRLAAGFEAPFILVSASAGFGKSSLIAEWIGSQPGLRASWLSLEASEKALSIKPWLGLRSKLHLKM